MQYIEAQMKQLEEKAKHIRRTIIQMLAKAGSGRKHGIAVE